MSVVASPSTVLPATVSVDCIVTAALAVTVSLAALSPSTVLPPTFKFSAMPTPPLTINAPSVVAPEVVAKPTLTAAAVVCVSNDKYVLDPSTNDDALAVVAGSVCVRVPCDAIVSVVASPSAVLPATAALPATSRLPPMYRFSLMPTPPLTINAPVDVLVEPVVKPTVILGAVSKDENVMYVKAVEPPSTIV